MDTEFTTTTIVSIIVIVSVAIASGLLGALTVYLRSQLKFALLREKHAALEATLESERHAATERIAELEKAREHLADTFGSLSNEALKANSVQFLKLAQENLKQFQIQAQNELTQKEK